VKRESLDRAREQLRHLHRELTEDLGAKPYIAEAVAEVLRLLAEDAETGSKADE